jgi:glycosyltransferase involved in cell wall biosynthesis
MEPVISVVVPTRDRPDALGALAGLLAGQTLPAGRFEVIVVDDGSQPPLRSPAAAPALTILRHESSRGPGAARNTGWRAAAAPLVAFVDDDCAPAPGWLEALVAAGEGPEPVIVQGPVVPDPRAGVERTPLTHTIEVAGPSPLFVTANIAYSRALLERTGGFDERLRRAGEDADMGARAVRAGARVRWAPEALVHHEVRDLGLLGTLAHTRKWSDAVLAVKKHPELRRLLFARVFWKPSHPLLLLAAAALATRRPLVMAAGALPYAAWHGREHRDPRALARWLPAHVAIDATEIATAVAGSLRHRTLML